MNYGLCLILLYGFIESLVEIYIIPCKVPMYGYPLMFLHHTFMAYINIGVWFTNPLYHLISIFILLFHWKFNNAYCLITTTTNLLCDSYESNHLNKYMYDFPRLLGITWPTIRVYLKFMISYDIYRILDILSRNKIQELRPTHIDILFLLIFVIIPVYIGTVFESVSESLTADELRSNIKKKLLSTDDRY